METELGKFFLCLVCEGYKETLTIHPIKNICGVDVIYPAEEIDEETKVEWIKQLKGK